MTYTDLLSIIQTRQAELSLSNRQLAIRSGLHPSTIGRIMSGKDGMSVDVLIRIAEAMGLEIKIEPAEI